MRNQSVIIFMLVLAFLTNRNLFAQKADQKSKELITALEEVNGGWEALAQLKDVEFKYTYDDKAKGKDISIERYRFADEMSWAEYKVHEVNVMPGKEGKVRQKWTSEGASISMDGNLVSDEQAIGGTAFLRRANYFWFTMMYKLDDPGTVNKYMGQEEIDGVLYDKVSLTYENTGKTADDEYILFFNPKTHLVDQFYFSLPAWGVKQPVLKMELDYEEIDGVLIATERRGIFPTPTGDYQLGGIYTASKIKFNNGFKEKDLKI